MDETLGRAAERVLDAGDRRGVDRLDAIDRRPQRRRLGLLRRHAGVRDGEVGRAVEAGRPRSVAEPQLETAGGARREPDLVAVRAHRLAVDGPHDGREPLRHRCQRLLGGLSSVPVAHRRPPCLRVLCGLRGEPSDHRRPVTANRPRATARNRLTIRPSSENVAGYRPVGRRSPYAASDALYGDVL